MEPTFQLVGTEHTFTPFGGPLEQTPPNKLLEDIGRAVMAWSRLEYIVVALALHINKASASAILHEPDPSSKLKAALKLVRKWLTEHPEFSHLRAGDDEAFFDSLLQHAELRNELVHGLLEDIADDGQAFVMRRLKRVDKDNWHVITAEYPVGMPQYLADQGTLAGRHFNEICKCLFDGAPETPSQTP